MTPCIQTERCLIEFISAAPEETVVFGERFANNLNPGLVIAINGCLGAGKTCFVKGIARGLGIKKNITSPTYTIMNEYSGRIPLYHIDAYRLNGDEDFESTGACEYFYMNGITVIEWSERIPNSIPADAVKVHIEVTGSQNRLIRIEGLN